ncbi:MAG TPA: glycosyltransferase [Rhizomicrobium sp.]
MSIRVAWVSPFGPRSDIGAFSRCLLPHFETEETGTRFDCDLFVNKNGPTYTTEICSTEIVPGAEISGLLGRYDTCFFNLGNNVENHGEIVRLLRSVPGIAILHDFSYHHFFAFKCFEELQSRSAYARLLHEYHGSHAFRMASRSGILRRGPALYAPWDSENVTAYPLMAPLAGLASAVIVHSAFMEEWVRRIFDGPVLRLFLPSDQKQSLTDVELDRWRTATLHKDRCNFASFGHVSRPKCLEMIITALAQSEVLRRSARLTIAGHLGDKGYAQELQSLIRTFGLSEQVSVEFDVSTERLAQIKRESDAFVNLRFPNTEGASGSLTEMLNAGKPVICFRSGCYAEIPEGAVVHVERAGGVPTIISAMERVLQDPQYRVSVGESGRSHIAPHSSREYVRQLKAFVVSHQELLHRRRRFVAPIFAAHPWDRRDVAETDEGWFDRLSKARLNFSLLERDPYVQSPEIFFRWPAKDLIALASEVLLHAPRHKPINSLITELLERLGRWKLYRLISKLRYIQALGERSSGEFQIERISDPDFWSIAVRLDAEAAVRVCWLAILGRPASAAERNCYAAAIRDGVVPEQIIFQILTSCEYRERFNDGVLAGIACWARDRSVEQARAEFGRLKRERDLGGVADPAIAEGVFRWPRGASVHFNAQSPAVDSLFGETAYAAEPAGVWTKGYLAQMRFRTSEHAPYGAKLLLKFRVTGTNMTGERQITAMCNEQEIGIFLATDDEMHEWEISIPAGAVGNDNPVGIQLLCSAAFCPAAAGDSEDERLLGLMLAEGSITPIEEVELEQPWSHHPGLRVIEGDEAALGRVGRAEGHKTGSG